MGVEAAVLWLSSFWLALYALRHHRRQKHRGLSLPAPTSVSTSSPELFRTRETRVTLRNLHLNIQSTAWNASHQYLAARLKRRDRWRAVLLLAYDIGSVLGVLGMLGSVLLLAWTAVRLAFSWYDPPSLPHTPSGTAALHKRDVVAYGTPTLSTSAQNAPLHLIIPGVTTPLHHLPILLAALLTTQIIHEAGHAIAGALEAVSLSSVGLGLTVILPSAFVAFPTGETEALPPRPRTRIIAAGAFHNLFFWACLAITASVRVSTFIWPLLGYRDVSAYGQVVVSVDEDSALLGHLPIGAIIYKVGDETLDGGENAADRWDTLLSTKPDTSTPALGWCAEELCASAPSQACFAPFADSDSGSGSGSGSGSAFERCLDPLPFLDPRANASVRRCASAVDCGYGELCVRPRGDQALVTLTMHLPPWLRTGGADEDVERTVVWQGGGSEILQEVEVGDWLPRYWFLPMGLPVVWSTLFMYLRVLTLSLYFFNLLPLPLLDGGQLLDVLLDWGLSGTADESIALGELEGGAAHEATYRENAGPRTTSADAKEKWRKSVHVAVGALLGSCTLLSLANAYS
ncbi:hypothetical protein C8Q76DRAFT_768815 [Earliella scabrosa]|nr:hypothetical protein C8Q76DRAFT_768815 [Earliella scabrosa]